MNTAQEGVRGLKAVSNRKSKTSSLKGFSHSLYNLLIKPVQDKLAGKKKLIIVTDGILGFVPFETLVDGNGQHLAETYDITYVQSMTILSMLEKRSFGKDRKPLLALGGAVYDEVTYSVDMIHNEKQLAALEKDLYAKLESKRSVRKAYGALDIPTWGNLPGSLSEVENIAEIFPGAKLYIGDEVTENNLKELSRSGDLAKYKILHFATHGLVVPAVPELSAIVLSQFKIERDGEDGYLRMREVSELNLKADFVNLSACETGLGKIYGGEGVVGLTQAFLIAGANGLSVSLWQVADESTSQFMVALYELVKQQGIAYSQAITEIKRKFIRGDFGDLYRAPFYWAPFVYYGK